MHRELQSIPLYAIGQPPEPFVKAMTAANVGIRPVKDLENLKGVIQERSEKTTSHLLFIIDRFDDIVAIMEALSDEYPAMTFFYSALDSLGVNENVTTIAGKCSEMALIQSTRLYNSLRPSRSLTSGICRIGALFFCWHSVEMYNGVPDEVLNNILSKSANIFSTTSQCHASRLRTLVPESAVVASVVGRTPMKKPSAHIQYIPYEENEGNIEQLSKLNPRLESYSKNGFRDHIVSQEEICYSQKYIIGSGDRGILFSADGGLVSKMKGAYIKDPIPPGYQIREKCIWGFNILYMNPYHWLSNSLSNVFFCRQFVEEGVRIVFPSLTDDQRDTLRMIGVEDKDIIEVGKHSVALSEVVWSTYLSGQDRQGNAGEAIRDVIDRMKMSRSDIEGIASPKLIYVTRRDSAKRRLVNENELEDIAAEMGFTIVELSGVDYRKKMSIFKNATHVVGLHGAGITSSVFSDNECRVCEIYPPEFFNGGNASINSICGNKYYFSCGGEIIERGANYQEFDWRLDLSNIRRFIAKLVSI